MAIRKARSFFSWHYVAILLCFLTLLLPNPTPAQVNFQGDFQKPLSWGGCGVGPNAIMLADLNGDGNLDVVTVDIGVQICLGDGHGNFNFLTSYNTSPGTSCMNCLDNTSALALGDFHHKGVPDIAVGSTNNIRVLLGNGDGTFRISGDSAVTGHPTQIAVADVNGDGNLDLVSVNTDTATISVMLGNGDGTFRPAKNISTSPAPFSIALGDFNGDGKIDAAIAFCSMGQNSAIPFRHDSCSESPVPPQLLLGNGDGTFQPSVSIPNVVGATNSIAARDVNGDGKLDLVIVTSQPYPSLRTVYSSVLEVLLGNGNGTFKPPAGYAINYPQLPGNNIAFGDFNGDGKLDIVVAGEGLNTDVNFGGTIAELTGNGDGTFQPAVFYDDSEVSTAVAAGDVDNDGKPDLVTSDFTQGNGNSGSVLLNANSLARSPTAIVVTSSGTSDPNDPFQPVTLTAAVTVPPGTLTGQRFGGDPIVTFQIDNQTVSANGFTNVALPASPDASGKATITVPFFGSGQHSVLATYPGNSTTLASVSAPITLTVRPNVTGTDLIFLLQGSSSATVSAGHPATFSLSVSSFRPLPPPGTVTLSCSNVSGVTCAFNPPSLVQPGRPIHPVDITLTVSTSPTAAANKKPFPATLFAAFVMVPLFAGFVLASSGKSRFPAACFFLLVVLALAVGCGGGGQPNPTPPPATPSSKLVSLTLTASGGTPSTTAIQQLTIKVTQ